ncbi:MAG: gliding motility lipoprotein GldH [Cytophagales bacterium]|nr:gliding motility lipoprotein GldH [Cytophagales bacterium]MDW8385106.1 hypothetical protein [Flammeovirgaceae bacterium]
MKKISLVLAFSVCLVSCRQNEILREFRDDNLGDMTWAESEKFVFKANIENDSIPYNFIVGIRHMFPIRYQYITVNVSLISSSGVILSKPYKIQLINDDKTPVGETAGNISDVETPIIQGITLQKGTYTIEIFPQSGEDLIGIMEVGIIVEKSQKSA